MTIKDMVAYKGLVACSLGLLLKEHAPLFAPAANRRVDIDGTTHRAPYWEEDLDGFIDRLRKNKGEEEVFAILLHEADAANPTYRYIGHTGIHGIKWPDGVGTTGSVIIDPMLQGKRIGTEAKLLLLYHCFYVLGLNNVRSSVKGWNLKSLAHLIKCGYRIVGRYKEIIFYEGRFVDEIVLQVSRKDFEPIWKKYQETKEVPRLTDEQRAIVEKEINT